MLARAAGAARRELSTAASKGKDRIVLVDGVRTPFHPSGTLFNNYIAQDLGRFAIKGLLARTGINPAELDYVTYGNVIQEGESRRATGALAIGCRRACSAEAPPSSWPRDASAAALPGLPPSSPARPRPPGRRAPPRCSLPSPRACPLSAVPAALASQ